MIAFIVLASLLLALALLRQRPSPNKPRALLDMTAFREARFNVFALSSFFVFAGAYTPFFYLAVFSQEKLGISESMSYNLLAILGAGSTFGRALPGLLAVRYGTFPVFALFLLICGLLQFIWGGINNLGGVVAFALFYGFFSGGVAGLAPVATIELSPTMEVAGTRMGMMLAFGAIGVLVGNPIAGAILDSRSEFDGVQAFGAATLLVASVLVVIGWELLLKYRKSKV